MVAGSLATLLDEGRYTECRQAAERLLREPDLADIERAQACLALSHSLMGLHDSQEAMAPGELAVYFGRRAGAYDLVGRALCHLAALYHENRLQKRAVACLEEYFRDFALYNVSRALEGWSLAHLALFYQAMGRHPKALEYFQKAYRWHSEQGAGPQHLDEHRADLIWQSLKLGDTDAARPLLAESAVYLQEVPNDLDARARYLNNQAYLHYLSGGYTSALDAAIQVVHMRGVSALRKAQACLTLHYTAKAMGHRREAMGLGTLVRIQASLGRRPDLEEEATRSMLHMQQDGGLPLMDELFRSVTVWAQRAAAARTD